MADIDFDEALQRAYEGIKSETRCPAHDDTHSSLSVAPGAQQSVLLHCHAGCDPVDVLAAAGLTWADVCKTDDDTVPNTDTWTPAGNASHIYPYRNLAGQVEFEVLRVPLKDGGKTFFQRRFDATTEKYRWTIEGAQRVLYRLPELTACVANGSTIYLPEGEKDVHTILRMGECATTNPGGAGKWKPEYSEHLAGATVIICSDTNAVGRAHARAVREQLVEHGCRVAIHEPPSGFKDVTAFIEAGGSLHRMLVVVPFEDAVRDTYGQDILVLIKRKVEDIRWVIPGTLAEGERCLCTGFEGHGKSTLCRQIAVMCAAGIHPWTLRPIDPIKVLMIDAENHPSQVTESWQQLVGLAAHNDRPIQPDMLTVLEEWDNSDLDLSAPDGAAWLHERVHAYKPQLVLMGPLTNMVGRDLKDDEPVRRLRNAVNSARSICGSAFFMEHHAPHKGPMDKERPVRPYGSSMFLKWPDFGYGLKPTETEGIYEWQRTRFPRVRRRIWPEILRNGNPNHGEWPWVEGEPT